MTLLEQYMADYQRVCAEKVELQEQVDALQRELDVETDSHKATSDALADEEDKVDGLKEQYQALDQWTRDALPQLSRLIDIIEGRHEEARLVPPHGQTSATPHALLDRWRKLHERPSNPASEPKEESA